jgi:hypothetical protein
LHWAELAQDPENTIIIITTVLRIRPYGLLRFYVISPVAFFLNFSSQLVLYAIRSDDGLLIIQKLKISNAPIVIIFEIPQNSGRVFSESRAAIYRRQNLVFRWFSSASLGMYRTNRPRQIPSKSYPNHKYHTIPRPLTQEVYAAP